MPSGEDFGVSAEEHGGHFELDVSSGTHGHGDLRLTWPQPGQPAECWPFTLRLSGLPVRTGSFTGTMMPFKLSVSLRLSQWHLTYRPGSGATGIGSACAT
jgi:hypothetical protein